MSVRSASRWPRLLGAAVAALAGSAMVLQLLDWMNGAAPPPPARDHRGSASFKVSRPPPPKQVKPRLARRPPPRRTQHRPRAPLPQLATNLSGVSFGIPGPALDGLSAVQDRLLGAREALDKVVMTASAVDRPPMPVRRVPPRYPSRARADGVTGQVTLRLLVGADGAVQQVEVLRATPEGLFERAATDAVRQWRFSPALYRGQPVKLWVTQRLRFEIG